jgi:sugar transferase (PEP-CTERM/EpsH1 system associated)
MTILYLAHRVPYPPNKGDKIRSFHQIRHLSRSHEVHLLAFCDTPDELQYQTELLRYCRTVSLIPLSKWPQRVRAALSMFRGEPLTLGYFASPHMRRAVRQLLAKSHFDVVFAFSSSMAPYLESVARIIKVLDFVDSDAGKWRQFAAATRPPVKWFYRYEAKRLKEFEMRMLNVFDCCSFVSPRETEHLPLDRANRKPVYIQNGIDLEFYDAGGRPAADSQTVVFVGAMDYFPNIDAASFFAGEVFPRVRTNSPRAKFLIVGSRPAQRVLKLGRLPGVTVAADVRDVRPFIAQARVAVAPLRISQGIQNKVLEALASGLPVVASPSAAAGLAFMPGIPLAVAEDAARFAERVCDFLKQPPLSPERIRACRDQLRRHHDWSTNLNAFENLILSMQ